MSRINMNEWSTNSIPYVAFDWLVNYKPKAWEFNIYLTESKEVKNVKSISWALITRRNLVLASSKSDKPVTSEDFDSFQEKLFFRETVKGWQVILKWVTYSEAKESQNNYFMSNSFRLATSLYLVTEKWAVIKLILTWTTRSKVNEALDLMKDIDFLTFTIKDEAITVGAWSRSQEIYPIEVVESKKEYTREIINKINSVIETLKKVKEYKKTWKVADNTVTADDAEKVFQSEEDDLPI